MKGEQKNNPYLLAMIVATMAITAATLLNLKSTLMEQIGVIGFYSLAFFMLTGWISILLLNKLVEEEEKTS